MHNNAKGCVVMRIKTKAAVFILTAAIMLSVCVTGVVSHKEDRSFIPRFTQPDYSNSFYYDDNIFYTSGFGIPNCTAYAWGRAYELCKSKPKLCTGNAGEWFDYNKSTGAYPYGTVPRLGAIACFDNADGGHVAVVENISDGMITFSNSAYMGSGFYLTTAKIRDKNPGQNGWIFQGYIYPGEFSRVELNLNSRRRINSDSGLNLRMYPSVNSLRLTAIPEKTEIFVTEAVENDGFFWAKTTYDGISGYCALDYTGNVL